MGVFYVKKSKAPHTALMAVEKSLSWTRLAVAAGLLACLLALAFVTAESGDETTKRFHELHTTLVTGFELLLGAVIGLLTGESIGDN